MQSRIDEFVAHVSTLKTELTAKAYRRGAELLEEFLAERRIDLEGAPRGLLTHFSAWLRKNKGLSPSTVVLCVSGAKRYCKFLADLGYDIPQLSEPELPTVKRRRPWSLSHDALKTYFEILENSKEPQRTALLLIPLSGLRSHEVCGLRYNDVIPKGKHVALRVRGKGGKERFAVVIRNPGNRFIRDYLKNHHMGRSVWLFPSPHDRRRPIATRTLRREMQEVRRQLGIPVTPHILRKTFNDILRRGGIKQDFRAELMGHESVETTYRNYTASHSLDYVVQMMENVNIEMEQEN